MTPDETVDRLASLPLLAAVPRDELEWATSRGEVRVFAAGTPLYRCLSCSLSSSLFFPAA